MLSKFLGGELETLQINRLVRKLFTDEQRGWRRDVEVVKDLSSVLDVTVHVRQQLGERRKLLLCRHDVGGGDCGTQVDRKSSRARRTRNGEIGFQKIAYPIVRDGNVTVDLLVDCPPFPEMRIGRAFVYRALVCRRALHEYALDELDAEIGIFLVGEDAVICRKPRQDNPLQCALAADDDEHQAELGSMRRN